MGADPPKNRNDWRNVEGAWKKKEAQSKILKKGLTILSKPACSWGIQGGELPADERIMNWCLCVDDSTKLRTDKEHVFIK